MYRHLRGPPIAFGFRLRTEQRSGQDKHQRNIGGMRMGDAQCCVDAVYGRSEGPWFARLEATHMYYAILIYEMIWGVLLSVWAPSTAVIPTPIGQP